MDIDDKVKCFLSLTVDEQSERMKSCGIVSLETATEDRFRKVLGAGRERNICVFWPYERDVVTLLFDGGSVCYCLGEGGEWYISPEPVMEISFSHIGEYIDHSCGRYNDFIIEIPDMDVKWDMFSGRGGSYADFLSWMNGVESSVKSILAEIYEPVFLKYMSLYRRFAKVCEAWDGAWRYEWNRGLMDFKDYAVALYILRGMTDEEIPYDLPMLVYYALTVGESGIDDDGKVRKLLSGLGVCGLTDPDMLSGISFSDYRRVYDCYVGSLPAYPLDVYVTAVNDEYHSLKMSLRDELMKKHGVGDWAFDESWTPEKADDLVVPSEC